MNNSHYTKTINRDDSVNMKHIFILSFYLLKQQRLCCFGNTTVFYFSLMCRRTHAQDRCLLASFSLYYLLLLLLLLVLLLAFSFRARSFSLSLIHFCILPHEYATQRETYASNKLSLDINRTLDFMKYFLFLTCVFSSSSSSFLPSHMRKTLYKRTEGEKPVYCICCDFVCSRKVIYFGNSHLL
jgi:hypothetical protein